MKLMDYGDVEIHVGEDGKFRATVDGHEMKSEKLDLLQKRLDKAAERGKDCAVPFTYLETQPYESPKFLRGMITGRHRGTGNALFSYEGGSRQLRDLELKMSAYAATHEQEAEIGRLFEARKAVERRYREALKALRDDGAFDRVRRALGEIR